MSPITIDGPSASGKTSVAKRVAKRLGMPYISSGLLYRGVTVLCLEQECSPEQIEPYLQSHRLELRPGNENQVWLDGQDITHGLHSLEVDAAVSAVAVRPAIRAFVNQVLQQIPPPFVIDGRDMGSTVFPHAQHKFYLTARPEVRAKRRVKEREAELEQVLAEIIRRDQADRLQSTPAADAVVLDTSELDLEGVVDAVLAHIQTNRS